jgi:hypothetical protein
MVSLTNTARLGFLVQKSNFRKKIPWIHWTPNESETFFYDLFQYEKHIPYFLSITKKLFAA